MIEFLAQTSRNEALLGGWGVFFVRFMLVALFLHYAMQSLQRVPGLTRFSGKLPYELAMHLLNFGLALFLAFALPPLRIFAGMDLLPPRSTMIWPDILFSALALSQIGRLWVYLIRYLEKRATA